MGYPDMSGLYLVTLVLGSCSALLYVVMYFLSRRRVALTPTSAEKVVPQYAILQRGEKVAAVRSDQPPRFLMGLLYAMFFYYATPIFIWRYGIVWGIGIIAIPMLADLVVINLIEPSRRLDAAEADLMLGVLLMVPIRAYCGLLLSRHDASIVLDCKKKRGWTITQYVRASSKKSAIASLRSHKAATEN